MKSSIKPTIYRYYSYTISLAKNREIAEEITQNTFYKAVSTTSQFKGKSDELTWLCSIAKKPLPWWNAKPSASSWCEWNQWLAIKMKMLRTQLQILTWRSAYTSFFTVWKNHTKKSFSFAYSGNYLFHKSLQFFGKTESWARVTYHRAKLKNSRKGWMKSMSKQCDIVRDILPLYVDGACSEASGRDGKRAFERLCWL